MCRHDGKCQQEEDGEARLGQLAEARSAAQERQQVAVDVAREDGGGAEHQAAAAAKDVDQHGSEGYAAEPGWQVGQDEGWECLQRVLQHADALRQLTACGLEGREFVGRHVVAAHVHAHEGAGGADERYECGAVDGAEFRLARRGCRPDALRVGLRADDAECEREAAAEVFQRAAGEEGAVAAVDVLGTGDVVQRRQLRRRVYLRNAVVYAAEAVAYVPHGDACRQRADVEQHQFDYAASPYAAYAAAEHHGGYEEGAYGQGPPHGQTEEAAEHGRRGEELRGDADEDAHKEENGTHCFGAAAILLAHHLHEGGASAAAQGGGVDKAQHQRAEGGADGEPPGREAEGEGQLGCAYGALAAHEGAEDGAADHPRACAAAGGEATGILHLAAREDAHRKQQADGEEYADDVRGGKHQRMYCSTLCSVGFSSGTLTMFHGPSGSSRR